LTARLTAEVSCGDGAFMSIIDPRSFEDGGLEWRLRYGNPATIRYIAAGVVESYDYLLSAEISTKEAIRRLRLLRSARRALQSQEAGNEG
jgi:hypothetical protein